MLNLINALDDLKLNLNLIKNELKSAINGNNYDAKELEALTKNTVLSLRQDGKIGADAFDQGYNLNLPLFFNDKLELLEDVAIEKTDLHQKIESIKSIKEGEKAVRQALLNDLKNCKENGYSVLTIPTKFFIEYLEGFNIKIHARTKGQLLKTSNLIYNAKKRTLSAEWLYLKDSGKGLSNGSLNAFKSLIEVL